jgi:hypothetical protein
MRLGYTTYLSEELKWTVKGTYRSSESKYRHGRLIIYSHVDIAPCQGLIRYFQLQLEPHQRSRISSRPIAEPWLNQHDAKLSSRNPGLHRDDVIRTFTSL